MLSAKEHKRLNSGIDTLLMSISINSRSVVISYMNFDSHNYREEMKQ